jgi:hypothetical protein
MRSLKVWLCFIGLSFVAVASAAPLRDGYPPAITGLIYKDTTANVIIYVETDGRHVVAISPGGRILWRKNPFVDAGLEPYRGPHPTIDFVGSSGPRCMLRPGDVGKTFCLSFSSSQFGEMDIATGKFTFDGQN